MAGFLAGPAAQLVGAGMQAMGVGIPLGDTSAKLIDGIRGLGVPVPPQTWFKRRGNRDEEAGGCSGGSCKSPNIWGMLQVARPVMEQLIGGSKSADRARRDRSSSPRKATLKYFTPQKCSSGSCRINKPRRHDSPQKKFGCKSSSCRKASSSESGSESSSDSGSGSGTDADERKARNSRPRSSIKSCLNCSRTTWLRALPCGRFICSRCEKSKFREHERKCKQCKKLTD